MGRGGAGSRGSGARVRALGNIRRMSRAAVGKAASARAARAPKAATADYGKQFKASMRRQKVRDLQGRIAAASREKAGKVREEAKAKADAERARARAARPKYRNNG